MFIIKQIEKKRIKNNILKKKNNNILYPLLVCGDYIIVWYINREQEKGLIRYQYSKGICMSIQYKGYNTIFQLRGVIQNIVVEQQYFYYSLNNILIIVKNIIKYYNKNSLKFLRKKKNKKSKFILVE